MSEWVSTHWHRKSDIDAETLHGAPEIVRMRSPFYDGERFAVRKDGLCLAVGGVWEWEPLPSSRDDEFYERCRFTSFAAATSAVTDADSKENSK